VKLHLPDPFRKPSFWKLEDMAFAMGRIAQEFPTIAKDGVAAAVNSAVRFVPPAEGRVKLMRRVREFVRPLR
jgi:hypothetical protein